MAHGGDPQGAWAKKLKINVSGDDLDAYTLTPGDYLQLVGHGGPLSGHIATAMKADPATGPAQTIWYVSGNAGRFGGGAIRIDSVTREKPPGGIQLPAGERARKRSQQPWGATSRSGRPVSTACARRATGTPRSTTTCRTPTRRPQRTARRSQGKIDADNVAIAAAKAQIARDDQSLIDEAAKVNPGESASTADAAEKMLKPKTPGSIWLTYVATTGKMDLNSLKPSSDPSMASWMKQWRASATR